jgi:hypothetical protein
MRLAAQRPGKSNFAKRRETYEDIILKGCVFGGSKNMKDFGNTVYAFGCVVAATVLGIGVADYWFGHHQLTAFLSWAVMAAIPWLIGRASLYVLARR